MDCDRFEATLIDELYDELDELTSAAAKRHIAGCSRCASLIGGLRATRRVAVLPILEPSVDLEDRILAAARNAQKVVPIGRRLSRAVSWAGSWAMRPQTAMAAVFVLMVGSSLLFVRRSKVMDAGSSLTVTAQGEPAPMGQASAAPADEQPSLDSKLAAAAHGTGPNSAPATAPYAVPSPTAAASVAAYGSDELALKEGQEEKGRALPMYAPKAPAKNASSGLGGGKDDFDTLSRNAAAPAGAPVAQHYAGPARTQARPSAVQADDAPVASDLDGVQRATGGGQGLADGRGAATDSNAALQAAHALRDSSGCAAAVSSLDQIAQQAWGTASGYQAQYDAAECYRAMGQNDQALPRYQRLITVQQYSQMASQGIVRMNQSQNQVASKAARKAAPAAKPSAVAVTPQATTQTPSQAAPAAPPPKAPAAADKTQTGF